MSLAKDAEPKSAGSAFAFPLKDAVSTVRDAALLIGVALYTVGFSYREGYFRALAIPPHVSAIDINETMLYAATVLQANIVPAVWSLAAFTALALLISYFPFVSAKIRGRFFGLLCAVSAALFVWSAVNMAWSTGIHEADGVFSELKGEPSTFTFDDKMPKADRASLERFNHEGGVDHLVLAGESTDSYFIVVATPNAGHWLPVYRVRKAFVNTIVTVPNNELLTALKGR